MSVNDVIYVLCRNVVVAMNVVNLLLSLAVENIPLETSSMGI